MTPDAHIAALPEPRRTDAARLDALFRAATGWEPRLYGKVIGYGQYHYRYASGRTGNSFATGFNTGPREIALHILPGYTDYPAIAPRLGPHRRGKSCWYFKRLDAVPDDAIVDLIRAGLEDLRGMYEVAP